MIAPDDVPLDPATLTLPDGKFFNTRLKTFVIGPEVGAPAVALAAAAKTFTPEAFDETDDAMRQRSQLFSVQDFLHEYGAEADLVEAIDIAVEDIERWIDPDIEDLLTIAWLASQEVVP